MAATAPTPSQIAQAIERAHAERSKAAFTGVSGLRRWLTGRK